MNDAVEMPRYSRFWLYTPITLLVLAAIAWSIAWFVIRDRTGTAIDRWIAAETRAGRQWVCADRRVTGFPFRIEVSCSALNLRRGEATGSVGAVRSVAQVYQPRHVITEIDGPMRLSDGKATIQGTWNLFETSFHGTPDGFQRGSIVIDAPNIAITGTGTVDLALNSRRFEAHVRPNPKLAAEGAFDVAALSQGTLTPLLDAFIGGTEPTDLQIDLTATQAQGFRGRPILDEIERWRSADGRIDVLKFSMTKGTRRFEASGQFGLDEFHRPTGMFNASAAGLDGLIAALTGNRAGGNLLGALLGQAPPTPAQPVDPARLIPLPPLRLENGRMLVGPFPVPGVRLPALY